MRRIVGWDTETKAIGKDAIYPPIICATFAERDGNGQVKVHLIANGDRALLYKTLHDLMLSDALLVGHNVAYDLMATCATFPDLEPLIWAKLERGEITDTLLREQLILISNTGRLDFAELPDGTNMRISFGLDAVVRKYLHEDISASKAEDQWRMHFELLDGYKTEQYPADAADYALKDAMYPLVVYEHQEEAKKRGNLNDPFHTAASFALACMTETGCRIDPDEFYKMKADLSEQLCDDKMRMLINSGILRPAEPETPYVKQVIAAEKLLGARPGEEMDWRRVTEEQREVLKQAGIKFKKATNSSLNTKILEAAVKAACDTQGIPCEYTPTGAVSCRAELIKALADSDPVLSQFFFRQSLQKLVTTELPRMEWEGKPAETVHAGFKCLISTLRTSSAASDKYPSWNGQNVDPRAKPVVIPRTGNVICSVDYATLELATVAHTTYTLFGESVHREKILAGYDLHAFLGAQLMRLLDADFRTATEGLSRDEVYKVFVGFKKGTPEERQFYAKGRKFAKPVGLGYPGGLGPERFIALAKKKPYWVDVEEIASHMPADFFEVDDSILWYFGKLHAPKELDKKQWMDWAGENFDWTNMMRAIYLAKTMRAIWLETYPEMAQYFDFVSQGMKDPENPNIAAPLQKPMQGYAYEAPTGEFIAGCAYTEVCNGFAMQTPAAIGAKLAVIRVVRACRDSSQMSVLLGSLPLLFIHDEILVEFPEDDLAHERAKEMQRLMSEAMVEIIPTVPVKTEAAMMRRWSKDAQPTFDSLNRLIAWEPAPTAVAA